MNKIFCIIFFCFLLVSFTVYSADFSNGFLNVNDVYKESLTYTAADLPNSDEILIDDYIYQKYNKDGTAVKWDDSYLKILTENGRQENKVLSFNYILPYSTVEIKKLQIVKSDGKIVPVDIAKNSKVMIDDSQMFSNIYNPNDKVLKLTIPELEIGDAIRCLVYVDTKKTIIPNSWFDLETFEGTFPIVHTKYEILSPNTLPLLKTALLSPVPGTVEESKTKEGDYTRFVWDVYKVPRMFKEPNMPPLVSVVQRVLVSTINSWEDVSKWYWELCLPHLNALSPEMKKTVELLTKDKFSDMEKIYAIYYFVAQQIRYMGLTIETDAPGFEPHDVNITFKNRYGVCRDKAALLVSMLRLANYNAYPVLIMVGPKLDKEVPVPYFNHAIVCVELNDFQTIFLDPTNENSKDPFPAYLCNRSYLIAKPKGDTLKVTPIVPADKNLTLIQTRGNLDRNNLLDAETVIRFQGINDTIYRNLFARLSPDERNSFVEKILRNTIPSAKLFYYTLYPENLLDLTSPLELKLRYSTKDIIIPGKDISLINLPWLGNSIGFVNFIIGTTGLTERKYPLVTEIACGYSEDMKITLDSNIKLDKIPQYEKIDSNKVYYCENLTLNKNILDCNSRFLINTVEFSPTQYLDLKEELKQIETDRKKMPICSVKNRIKSQDIGQVYNNDARILSKAIDISLKNESNWKETYDIRLKILSYNGKKDNSEFKINFNPIWEKVKLLKAEVISSDGKVQKVTQKEINIMDEAWNGSAPRYPGGKIFVVNLPGVEINSIVDIKYEITYENKPFYSDIYSFRNTYPIDDIKISLVSPKNLALKILQKNTGNITESIIPDSNTITYIWKSQDLSGLVSEVSLPPQWVYLPTVLVSTGDMKKYFNDLNNNLIEKTQNQNLSATKADELTKNLKTDKEKIIAIRDFISKRINNAGPSFVRLPFSCLSNADTTLSDGYGNNADIAILYYTMLKSIGFSPEFVLSSGYQDIPEVLNNVLDIFQREILPQLLVGVKDKNSDGYIYLNDTDEFSAYGCTNNEGNVGFVLPSTKKIIITPLKDRKSTIIFNSDITLTNTTSAQIKVTRLFYGNYFGEKNRFFSLLTPEDKRRYYKETIANISQCAEPISKLETNFKVYPGQESFTIKVGNFSTLETPYLYFNTFKNAETLFNLGSKERFYPYFIPTQEKFTINNQIFLPDKTQSLLIVPENQKLPIPNMAGNIDIISKKINKLKLQNSINIDVLPAIIAPENYSKLIDIYNTLNSDKNSTYLLKMGEFKN